MDGWLKQTARGTRPTPLKFSDAPIVKEISQDWNVNISYDAKGNIVEMVVLETKEAGLYPVQTKESKVA